MQVKGGQTTARSPDFVSSFNIYFWGIDLFHVYLHFKNHYRGGTPFGPPMWHAEVDTEIILSASSTTAVGQKGVLISPIGPTQTHIPFC